MSFAPVIPISRLRRLVARLGDPARFARYLILKLSYKLKLLHVPITPIRIDIEPINSCNFRCNHCQVTHWDKAKAQLDINAFKRIIDSLPHIDEVKLQGMGEPLLNKQFIDLLKEGERRGLTMRFHSNASACTEPIARRLLELKNTHITFSIDGATAATFERVRPGSNFARIVRNVRYFTGARNGRTSPSISGWTVLTTDNIRELPQIVQLCIDLGLDRVSVQPFLTSWGKPEEMGEFVTTVEVHSLSDAYADLLHEAHTIAEAGKMELNIIKDDVYTEANKCKWPWESAYIAANGDVVPCCIIADADVAKMGNVFEQPFEKIWNGQEYRTLRTRIKNHDLPDYCKACYGHATAPAAELPKESAVG